MTFDFNTTILNFDGKPLTTTTEDKTENLTWGFVINEALNAIPTTTSFTVEDKAAIYDIQTKIHSAKDGLVYLDYGERVFITDRVQKVINLPIVYGRVKEFLDINTTQSETTTEAKPEV